jgi:myo-inositol catabolism protein IolC
VPEPLAILAFDHRSSFLRSFLGVEGEPSPDDLARARTAKTLIAEGLVRAVEDGRVPAHEAGALVDARFGDAAIARVREAGLRVAVPVEASGRREVAFESEGWREALDALAPDWAKVLVRYHPDDDEAMNARQRATVRELRAHCDATERALMIELLVPPLPGQEGPAYDAEVRPDLLVRSIDLFHEAGISADLWKIEGFERAEDYARVARSAIAPCVVLGRGADRAAVERWLRAAAGVEGFAGFAIGRSIWWDALRDLPWEDRDAVVGAIAAAYASYADAWRDSVAATR